MPAQPYLQQERMNPFYSRNPGNEAETLSPFVCIEMGIPGDDSEFDYPTTLSEGVDECSSCDSLTSGDTTCRPSS
jgi:hypothetical protein